MLEQLQPRSGGRRTEETESRKLRPEKMQSGMGSGLIVTAEGVILTNNHVIADADELQIELSDGRLFNASVIGSDIASDVAVLKIDATGLTPARLGNSTAMEVGDWVLAIGSPFRCNAMTSVYPSTITAVPRFWISRRALSIPYIVSDFLYSGVSGVLRYLGVSSPSTRPPNPIGVPWMSKVGNITRSRNRSYMPPLRPLRARPASIITESAIPRARSSRTKWSQRSPWGA